MCSLSDVKHILAAHSNELVAQIASHLQEIAASKSTQSNFAQQTDRQQTAALSENQVLQNLRENSHRLHRQTGTDNVNKTPNENSSTIKRRDRTITECFTLSSDDSDASAMTQGLSKRQKSDASALPESPAPPAPVLNTKNKQDRQETMTKADAADAADAAEATETYLDRLVVFQPSPAFRSVRGIAGKKILKRSAWAKLRVDKMDAESTNTPYVRKTKDGRAWIVTIYIPLASMIQNAYIGRLHVEARFADLEEAIKFRDTTLAAHGLDIIVNSNDRWQVVLVDKTCFPIFKGIHKHKPIKPMATRNAGCQYLPRSK